MDARLSCRVPRHRVRERTSGCSLTDSRSEIDLQLHTVGMEFPVSQMAAAFKPPFGRLDGTVGASGATDHDALLEASELMPIGAEQVFEKAHSISAHGLLLGLPRTEGFDLTQYSTYFANLMPPRPFPLPWSIEDIGGCFVVRPPMAGRWYSFTTREGIARRSLARLLTRNAARRIAASIAKLPSLFRKDLNPAGSGLGAG
jgi:hypothetical protein